MKPQKLSVLISYAYLKSGDLSTLGLPLDEWEFILDSGAFTNFTTGREVCTLDGYIEFCKEYRHIFAHVVNMDRIGDPVASAANLKAIQSAGIENVMPVFQRGGSTEQLRQLCREGHDLVAVGGVAQASRTATGAEYIASVMRVMREEGQRTHLLGVSSLRSLEEHQPFSSDSSSWCVARRWGRASLFHGNKMLTFGARSKITAKKTNALRAYGLSWSSVKDPDSWLARNAMIIAEARSFMRAAQYLRRRGVRYVFAGELYDLFTLQKAWELERQKWGWT